MCIIYMHVHVDVDVDIGTEVQPAVHSTCLCL